jgi:hypothetical protein
VVDDITVPGYPEKFDLWRINNNDVVDDWIVPICLFNIDNGLDFTAQDGYQNQDRNVRRM